MKNHLVLALGLLLAAHTALAQEKDVNGARNNATDGTSFNTNTSFTLRMTLAGQDTPLAAAELGQDISITAIIRPEAEDVGQPADVIIVDYIPGQFLRMRNLDGNFQNWNGALPTLVPALENVTLQSEVEVEVFSGQLANTGNHRIFVGFLAGDNLYFTPSALRFDINEAAASFRDQAMAFFESTISNNIVQGSCITCHRSGGVASGTQHLFVFPNVPDHVMQNYMEMEGLHASRGTDFILNKVQGFNAHGGGTVLPSGSSLFTELSDFLNLLDQAAAE